MTSRDPNNPDFFRKVQDFYDCIQNYWKLSDVNKLQEDVNRPDINLVCYYELHQIREHVRQTNGLNYNDFVKLSPSEEKAFSERLGH